MTVLPSEVVSIPATQPAVPRPFRFRDVLPVAGLALAAAVNVGWIAVLGYGLFRLALWDNVS